MGYMNGDGTRRIFAASDLHIGAPYADWQRTAARVEKGVRESDITVLCGDIFEGTVMLHIPVERRIEMGKNALKRWSDANPDAKIHLLFGNHEAPLIKGGTPLEAPYLEVGKAIRDYAETLPNVEFHEKGWVQLGDALFTHGHIQTGFTERAPHVLRQTLELLPNIALPGYAAGKYVFPTREMVEKIHASFSRETLNGPVNHIVFGHTHAPMQAYSVPGLRLGGSEHDVQFHNLGASIVTRPQIFQPLMLEQDINGMTQQVRRAQSLAGARR